MPSLWVMEGLGLENDLNYASCKHLSTAMLIKLLEPLIGSASILYANGEDWQLRQKCLYHNLKGSDLKSYFSHFVSIAKVGILKPIPLSH